MTFLLIIFLQLNHQKAHALLHKKKRGKILKSNLTLNSKTKKPRSLVTLSFKVTLELQIFSFTSHSSKYISVTETLGS